MPENKSQTANGFPSAEELKELREILELLRECLPVIKALADTGNEMKSLPPSPSAA